MQLVTGEINGSKGKPVVVVHGGAWAIHDEECDAHVEGMGTVLREAESLAQSATSSNQMVVAILSRMEDSGVFDAGCGAVLNREGRVELDAGMMCGHSKIWGAVAGIQHFKNPTQIAYEIAMRGKGQFCFLPQEEAETFAKEAGFSPIPNEELICEREQSRYEHLLIQASSYHTSHPFLASENKGPTGTIGCVALDADGRLAAATSTGGTPFRRAGRIGDSPLPGCGYFANAVGAASATGWGEAIASMALCRTAVGYLEHGLSPVDSVGKALESMKASIKNTEGEGGTGGLILLNAEGRGAWGYTTPRMARGWAANGQRFMKVT